LETNRLYYSISFFHFHFLQGTLVQTEKQEVGTVSNEVYMSYFKSGTKLLLFFILFSFLNRAASKVLDAWFENKMDNFFFILHTIKGGSLSGLMALSKQRNQTGDVQLKQQLKTLSCQISPISLQHHHLSSLLVGLLKQ